VRLAGDGAQDQARVVTPRAAALAGARYVILGRTETAAPDPKAAMVRVAEDLAGAVSGRPD
jgi:orotidine-5'-phosphate decarboxylase